VVAAGYAKPVTFSPGTIGGSKAISRFGLDDVANTIHQLRQGSGMKILVDVSQGCLSDTPDECGVRISR
jgi:hypothetical protein